MDSDGSSPESRVAAAAEYRAQMAETKAAQEWEARDVKLSELRNYLTQYLELQPGQNAETIRFENAAGLEGEYADQSRFLKDERLAGVEIAVVPDGLWAKGASPSESHADRGLILMKEGYFHDPQKKIQDETAWMTHELAHCQQFMDRGPEGYAQASEAVVFNDLGPEKYPNNQVEEQTFTRQFEYLKAAGIDREQVTGMLEEHYGSEQFRFLDRILDRVYSVR